MTSQIIPVEPFDFIVFGGTGDLSERKLLPALYHRQRDGQFSEPTRIIGTSRSKLTDDEFKEFARKAIKEHVQKEYIDKAEVDKFLNRLSYVPADAMSGTGFDDLKKKIGNSKAIRAFYLAVAPALFGKIAEQLKKHEVISENSRIVVEKPIGRDLASAKQLNDEIGKVFGEAADLPHRPLSRQGDGAEPDGAALRQRAVRAAVELGAYRPCPDHRRRNGRPRRPRPATTTRPARCATWCRTTSCSCSAWSRWSRPPPCRSRRGARREAEGAALAEARSTDRKRRRRRCAASIAPARRRAAR
jgi:hypothetical protein